MSFLVFLGGCTPSGEEENASVDIGVSWQAIVDGQVDREHPAVVQLGGPTGGVGKCTGTLVTPRHVLTARHCVVRKDVYGNPAWSNPIPPDQLGFWLYWPSPWDTQEDVSGETDVHLGQAVHVPPAALSDSIVLVELATPITEVRPALLAGEPRVELGLDITAVGFETGDAAVPSFRQSATSTVAEYGIGKFILADEVTHDGDSGSPAFAWRETEEELPGERVFGALEGISTVTESTYFETAYRITWLLDTIGDDADFDWDGDGTPDRHDNCAAVANDQSQDLDSDRVGDACDICPEAPNSDQRDSDDDGVGDACDNCVDDFNPSQANCDHLDDEELGVDLQWRGDACDPDPCVELPVVPRLSDEVLGTFGLALERRVGRWVDLELRTWGGLPTETGDFRYAEGGDWLDDQVVLFNHCECEPTIDTETGERVCLEPLACPREGLPDSGWNDAVWRRPTDDESVTRGGRIDEITFARSESEHARENRTEIYWPWQRDMLQDVGAWLTSADAMLWLRPDQPYEWPEDGPERAWDPERRNTYTQVLDLRSSIVLGPTIPADVLHGRIDEGGIGALPRPFDLAPSRLDALIPGLGDPFREQFEMPSVMVATIGFDSPLLQSPYALETSDRAALGALAVRHQWTGSGFVSEYLPASFEGESQLDLDGFAMTVMVELPMDVKASVPTASANANDLLALWTFGGADRHGEVYDELWRGVLDRSGAEPVYRFSQMQASSGPDPRRGAMLFSDPERQRLVLFGGRWVQGFLRDLWSFDLPSRQWQREDVPVPAEVGLEGAAHHVASRIAYVFGGVTEAGPNGTLWRLDLRSLRFEPLPSDPGEGPGPRLGATMIMDAVEDVLYLYGGFSGQQWHNDLWAYDLDRQRWELIESGCDPGDRCPPPALGSALISSGTPGAVTMALGTPSTDWEGTEHEWRYVLSEGRWWTEDERRNLWLRRLPPSWCSVSGVAGERGAVWFAVLLLIFTALVLRMRRAP